MVRTIKTFIFLHMCKCRKFQIDRRFRFLNLIMQLHVPFVVYWLIVKDFFRNIDICENEFEETGYCVTNSECSNIANGTVIGLCESESSSSVCCLITVNYYNTTYSLKPMFTARNPTDKPQKVMLFSSSAYGQIDYGGRRISSKRSTRKREVIFNEKVHACVSPDKIIWPVTASYSRESRNLRIRRPYSGTTYLFIVEVNKIYSGENVDSNLTLECLSKLNASESDATESDQLSTAYLKVNNEVIFPLRNFLTPEIQNLKSTNFTDGFESLFPEPEPQERKSTNQGTCMEDSCEKEELDSHTAGSREDDDTVASQSDSQLQKRKLHVDNLKSHDHNILTEGKSNSFNHKYRKPVLTDPTHDMRRPVKTHKSHDRRKPVSLDKTHDKRKPVSLDESHDLRWPVVEEESDLRNVYKENEIFVDDDILMNTLRDSDLKSDPFDCKKIISLNKEQIRNYNPDKVSMLTMIYDEANEACGAFTNMTYPHVIMPDRKWPWMVSLTEKKSGKFRPKCSAALLNSKWVITVAHCVDMKYKSDFKLVLGNKNHKHGKNYVEVEIDEIIIHKDFNRGKFENDLALLRMKSPVVFTSHIMPICLPDNPDFYTDIDKSYTEYGIPVFLSWKHKQKSDYTPNMAVPLIENSQCEMLYSVGKNKERITDTFICAGKDDGNCDSESGSSLIAPNIEDKWMLIGLVSWGSMCSNLEQPSVYVRIASFEEWIKQTIVCYEIYV